MMPATAISPAQEVPTLTARQWAALQRLRDDGPQTLGKAGVNAMTADVLSRRGLARIWVSDRGGCKHVQLPGLGSAIVCRLPKVRSAGITPAGIEALALHEKQPSPPPSAQGAFTFEPADQVPGAEPAKRINVTEEIQHIIDESPEATPTAQMFLQAALHVQQSPESTGAIVAGVLCEKHQGGTIWEQRPKALEFGPQNSAAAIAAAITPFSV